MFWPIADDIDPNPTSEPWFFAWSRAGIAELELYLGKVARFERYYAMRNELNRIAEENSS